jgi:chromosome segregation ATPase
LQKENAKLKAAPGKAAAVKSADVEDLEEEIAELNGLVQKLSQDVSNLQADKADLEKELQKAQSGKGGGGGNQAKLQEENEGLRNQMEDLERHLDELEATIASKNKTIRELETKVKAGGGGGGKGGAETEELKKKLQLMEGVLEGAAFFPPFLVFVPFSRSLQDLEQEIQDLKQENEALNDRLASKGGGGDSSRLEEELIEAQNQASQYKAKLGLLRAEYKKLLSQQKK